MIGEDDGPSETVAIPPDAKTWTAGTSPAITLEKRMPIKRTLPFGLIAFVALATSASASSDDAWQALLKKAKPRASRPAA
jgi:hypothetical protein